MSLLDRITAFQRGGRILLDSNLLLLLTVGSFDPKLIQQFKRTEQFSSSHFELLVNILESFKTLVTTPHILTEVSNLANALPSHIRPYWAVHFSAQMELLSEAREESRIVAQHRLYPEFGLTDASIARLTENTLVLTQDNRLAARLNQTNFCALNLDDLLQLRSSIGEA